jgi:hypothetical protein
MAMDSEHIVWAGFVEPETGPESILRMVSRSDLRTVITLAREPIETAIYWAPALRDGVLWYTLVDPDFALIGVEDEFHIVTVDLGDPTWTARRFAGTGPGNHAEAVLDDRYLVWKACPPGESFLNWGTLWVRDRRTEEATAVPVPKVGVPSIGDRYLAFEELTRARLSLYDLRAGTVLDLATVDPLGNVHYGGQSLSGRLLTWYVQDSPRNPRIEWALLPD